MQQMYFHWADLIIRDRTWPIPWDGHSIALVDRLYDRCSQTSRHIHPNDNHVHLLGCLAEEDYDMRCRVLTADFHVAKGWRLRHWLAALRKWGGPRPAWHLLRSRYSLTTIFTASFDTKVNIWLPISLLFKQIKRKLHDISPNAMNSEVVSWL